MAKTSTKVKETISTIEKCARLIKLGKLVFFGGVIVVILAGFIEIPYLAYILIIAGLIVGFLNIVATETKGFLIATIALMLVGTAGLEVFTIVGTYIQSILKNILAFVAPAALVVALKSILAIEKG